VTAALFLQRSRPTTGLGAFRHLRLEPQGRPGFTSGGEAQAIRGLYRMIRERFREGVDVNGFDPSASRPGATASPIGPGRPGRGRGLPDPKAMRRVAVPTAALRQGGRPEPAEQMDQLLFGERLRGARGSRTASPGARRVATAMWASWPQADLANAPGEPATHQVAVPRTYAFSEPSIKSRPSGLYSLNSLTTIEAVEGRFAKVARARAGSSPPIWRRWAWPSPTTWRWRERLSGRALPVGRPRERWGWIARAWSSRPWRPAARPARATPTCSWPSSPEIPEAELPARRPGVLEGPRGHPAWTPRPSCTPTATTWPWRSSPWPGRSPASRRPVAAGSRGGAGPEPP
jgi:hypothetical protein